VPAFVALVESAELPPVGTTIEKAVLDLKRLAAASAFHRAKDVAAFANHLGGTLLLGAAEAYGRLGSYTGLTRDQARSARSDYSASVTQRCDPRPSFDFAQFDCPFQAGKFVVAINVTASLNLVGVNVQAVPDEDYRGNSIVFPIRSGIDADYLTPPQLPMYMTPQVRRMAVMLARVPVDASIKVITTTRRGGDVATEYWFKSVDESANLVILYVPTNQETRRLPLDRFLTVYEAATNQWVAVVELYQ